MNADTHGLKMGAPEIGVPVQSLLYCLASIAREPKWSIEHSDRQRSVFSVEPGHRTDAKRVREEDSEGRPDKPREASPFVCRVGRLGIGDLGHARTVAGLAVPGKELGH
jgi:hypothetical protein